MENNKFKQLIIKFLNRNFPITKVKKRGGKRFRRGIIISAGFTGKPDAKYYISDKADLSKLYGTLFNILENVFGIGATHINPILMNYLNLI